MNMHSQYNAFITGLVTNGEHNGLRLMGNTRPIHLFKLRNDARSKVLKLSHNSLVNMLTPKGKHV